MCDEAHFLKNGEAQITQAVAGLSSAKRRLLMSGEQPLLLNSSMCKHACNPCVNALYMSLLNRCTVLKHVRGGGLFWWAAAAGTRRTALCHLLLAGTPIQNDLSEFHAVFDLACPGLLGDLKAFNRTYEGPIQRGRDADATEKQASRASRVLHIYKLCIIVTCATASCRKRNTALYHACV
jgi:hypothetical protein